MLCNKKAGTLFRIPAFSTSNRSDVIRTRDLYVPNVALYQAEPHSAMKLKKLRKRDSNPY